jgi:hypothetical protein
MKPLLQHAIDLVFSADSIQYTEHGFWWWGHYVADALSAWPVHGYIPASEENDGRKLWTPTEDC